MINQSKKDALNGSDSHLQGETSIKARINGLETETQAIGQTASGDKDLDERNSICTEEAWDQYGQEGSDSDGYYDEKVD